MLIYPRDKNIAKAVIKEVEEVRERERAGGGGDEGGRGEEINIVVVVGGNHVGGIVKELEKYGLDL